jgi:uncharacterized protein
MQIDWNHFTPLASLLGGVIIGLAAAYFVLVCGRILGVSGIVGGLLQHHARDKAWRWAFILGMVASPWVYLLGVGQWAVQIDASWGAVVAAGLLVGIGTRYGSGCTSGHGVCGLSRFSLRSLVATCVFMGAGFLLVALIRHIA